MESFQPEDSLADRTKKFLLNYYSQISHEIKSISLDSLARELLGLLDVHKENQSLYDKVKNDPNELRKRQ